MKQPSLISNEKICYVCRTTENLHKHHIYPGKGRRSLSEKYGCWAYLCAYHHDMSNESVHHNPNKGIDLELKQKCQERWERKFGSRADFIKNFNRSYL